MLAWLAGVSGVVLAVEPMQRGVLQERVQPGLLVLVQRPERIRCTALRTADVRSRLLGHLLQPRPLSRRQGPSADRGCMLCLPTSDIRHAHRSHDDGWYDYWLNLHGSHDDWRLDFGRHDHGSHDGKWGFVCHDPMQPRAVPRWQGPPPDRQRMLCLSSDDYRRDNRRYVRDHLGHHRGYYGLHRCHDGHHGDYRKHHGDDRHDHRRRHDGHDDDGRHNDRHDNNRLFHCDLQQTAMSRRERVAPAGWRVLQVSALRKGLYRRLLRPALVSGRERAAADRRCLLCVPYHFDGRHDDGGDHDWRHDNRWDHDRIYDGNHHRNDYGHHGLLGDLLRPPAMRGRQGAASDRNKLLRMPRSADDVRHHHVGCDHRCLFRNIYGSDDRIVDRHYYGWRRWRRWRWRRWRR